MSHLAPVELLFIQAFADLWRVSPPSDRTLGLALVERGATNLHLFAPLIHRVREAVLSAGFSRFHEFLTGEATLNHNVQVRNSRVRERIAMQPYVGASIARDLRHLHCLLDSTPLRYHGVLRTTILDGNVKPGTCSVPFLNNLRETYRRLPAVRWFIRGVLDEQFVPIHVDCHLVPFYTAAHEGTTVPEFLSTAVHRVLNGLRPSPTMGGPYDDGPQLPAPWQDNFLGLADAVRAAAPPPEAATLLAWAPSEGPDWSTSAPEQTWLPDIFSDLGPDYQPGATLIHCPICFCDVSGRDNWIIHLSGERHRTNKLTELNRPLAPISASLKCPVDSCFTCKMCHVYINGRASLLAHLGGRPHTRRCGKVIDRGFRFFDLDDAAQERHVTTHLEYAPRDRSAAPGDDSTSFPEEDDTDVDDIIESACSSVDRHPAEALAGLRALAAGLTAPGPGPAWPGHPRTDLPPDSRAPVPRQPQGDAAPVGRNASAPPFKPRTRLSHLDPRLHCSVLDPTTSHCDFPIVHVDDAWSGPARVWIPVNEIPSFRPLTTEERAMYQYPLGDSWCLRLDRKSYRCDACVLDFPSAGAARTHVLRASHQHRVALIGALGPTRR